MLEIVNGQAIATRPIFADTKQNHVISGLYKEMTSSSMEFLLIRQYWRLQMNLRTTESTISRNDNKTPISIFPVVKMSQI